MLNKIICSIIGHSFSGYDIYSSNNKKIDMSFENECSLVSKCVRCNLHHVINLYTSNNGNVTTNNWYYRPKKEIKYNVNRFNINPWIRNNAL